MSDLSDAIARVRDATLGRYDDLTHLGDKVRLQDVCDCTTTRVRLTRHQCSRLYAEAQRSVRWEAPAPSVIRTVPHKGDWHWQIHGRNILAPD